MIKKIILLNIALLIIGITQLNAAKITNKTNILMVAYDRCKFKGHTSYMRYFPDENAEYTTENTFEISKGHYSHDGATTYIPELFKYVFARYAKGGSYSGPFDDSRYSSDIFYIDYDGRFLKIIPMSYNGNALVFDELVLEDFNYQHDYEIVRENGDVLLKDLNTNTSVKFELNKTN
jgi:hypothetical protein